MPAAVIALLDALLALIVALNVVHLATGDSVATHNTATGERGGYATSAVSCEDGVATYWRAANQTTIGDIEELAHAWHCEETGSLFITPPEFPLVEIPKRPGTFTEAYSMGVPYYYWAGMRWTPGAPVGVHGPLAEAEWLTWQVRQHAEGLR